METERAKRLAGFVSWVGANIKEDEKGEAQVFLERIKGTFLGERQVKAYPRTQTDRRIVGKANGRRIIGAFRTTLFGTTFRFV